ncbi:mboat family protein, putative [Ichthyophthirius multifiliis]|uniref:Mboat family protein, putative n=1 Tax=Ichthyophthirius multifiliis TaxID=5932 RepID=G0R4Q7_ICHMU|nr:mboat family protein, putative [Ichthyophthirius multifiliis]EGR27563.1 mboat family protein, putative [Ichthyophthirius multifiliis]|eukprot:XP_004025015.1 mboat family protein, putative [Ichthyophthirius multifiliis]
MIFQILDQLFQNISILLGGMEVDQIRLAVSLIMTIPFGLIFYFIRGFFIRHLIGSALGIFLQYLVYQDGLIFLLFQTVFVYIIILIFQRKSALIVFSSSLFYLSLHHLYRQYNDYGGWKMDITTILMMTMCKYTSFAWCYQDGDQKLQDQLSEDQKLRKIEKLPNFFEYFSYIHFFGSAICGPTFDFHEYKIYMRTSSTKSISFPLKNSLNWLLQGLAFTFTIIFLLPKFPLKYVLTEEYNQSSMLFKFYYFNVCITLIRFRYYAGWSLSQAGLASTGITYNTKTQQWDQIISCKASHELTHDVRYKVECWNTSVQIWLKKYVYLRVYPQDQLKSNVNKSNIAQYITNMVSAFWHGFYPGYYLSFFQWSLVMNCSKLLFNASKNKPEFFDKLEKTLTSPVYFAIRFCITHFSLNCFGIGFQLLSLYDNYAFYKTHYFSVLIVNLLVIAFFSATKWGQKSSKPKAQ